MSLVLALVAAGFVLVAVASVVDYRNAINRANDEAKARMRIKRELRHYEGNE